MGDSTVLYRVFLSSPSGVEDLRDEACEEIRAYNQENAKRIGAAFLPIRWESTGAVADNPQEHIDRTLLSNADYFVMILKDRYGSPTDAGGSDLSGTKAEFDKARKRKQDGVSPMKDLAVFFAQIETAAPDNPDDKEQLQKVMEFKARLFAEKKIFYRDLSEKRNIRDNLRTVLDDWAEHHRKAHGDSAEGVRSAGETCKKRQWRYSVVAAVLLISTLVYTLTLFLTHQYNMLDSRLQIMAGSALIAVNLSILLAMKPRARGGRPSSSIPRTTPVLELMIATAAAFSLWSMLATVLIPPHPALGDPLGWSEAFVSERRLLHAASLLCGCLVVCSIFTVLARRNRDQIREPEIVYRVGFLGMLLSGLIGLAVAMPYSWPRLAEQPSPLGGRLPWLSLASYIILARMAVFPILGALASLVTYRLFVRPRE